MKSIDTAEVTSETLSHCPNPLCTGKVQATDTTCTLCGHELGPCPNCGKLISINLGRCGRCGYRLKKDFTRETAEATGQVDEQLPPSIPEQPAAVPSVPLVIRFEAARDAVTKQIAEAYYKMASAEADMAQAADVLEDIRSLLVVNKNALTIWKGLTKEIGAAEARSRKALVDLREWFTSELFAQLETRLREVFNRDRETGWNEWLVFYAEGLAHWRLQLCQRLVSLSLPFPDKFSEKNFKLATQLTLHERWTEVYSFFQYLAQHEFVNAITRARLLITVGQIYLYFFPRPERALLIFKQAEELAPNLPRCLSALGDYQQQVNDLETATGFFKRVIAVGSDEPEAYTGMGDIATKQGNLEEARNWFQEAMNRAPAHTEGYTQLLRLYGRPEFIDRYESQISALAERASAIDETGEYKFQLDVGDAYSASKRFDEAQASYQRAINLDPKRLNGYMWKGFTYLDQGESTYDAAGEAFTKALEVAPESYSGSWGMGQLCERRQQWREAADWYAKVSERQPELQSAMLARIGDMHIQLAEYDRAEQAFIEAFKLDGSAEDFLINLADDYYRKLERPEDARRLYKQIRELKGETFEAAYRNRLGNVDLSEGNYAEAAKHYEAAIELDAKQAIYYTNLSDAHRLLKNLPEARTYLEKAFQLNGDKVEHDAKLALILNNEGNELFARARYEQAIDSYSEAEKLDPTQGRFFSNRALALEQMIPNSSTPLELLDRAIADMQKAVGLTEKQENASELLREFSEKLTGLERRRTFVSQYGASALTLDPRERTARLYLRQEPLISVINSDQTALSDEFMKLIDALHDRLTEKFGLRFPTIMVYSLNPAEPYELDYVLEIMFERLLEGNLDLEKQFALCSAEKLAAINLPTDKPGLPVNVLGGYWLTDSEASEAAAHGIKVLTPQEYLLRCVETSLSWNLDKCCGHQEVANMLEQHQTPDSIQIRQDPERLHELTLALKNWLIGGKSVAELKKFYSDFNSRFSSPSRKKFERKSEPDGTVEAHNWSLQVGLSPKAPIDRNLLNDAIAKLQIDLFSRLGVIFPLPSIIDKEDLESNEIQVQVSGKEVLRVVGPGPDEFVVTGSVEELRERYPNARSLFDPPVEVPALVLPRSEGLETELNNAGYPTFDATGLVLGLVLVEVNKNPDLFLTRELLEHYLAMLNTNVPALVAVTQHYFSKEELLDRLRRRLRAGSSIKNMPEVLEVFLSDPATETAGIN